jgi:hypothetical protein
MLLPAGPLGLWEVPAEMGAHGIFPPQRRFSDAIGDLHHIFHLEIGTLRIRLGDELHPSRELRGRANERVP